MAYGAQGAKRKEMEKEKPEELKNSQTHCCQQLHVGTSFYCTTLQTVLSRRKKNASAHGRQLNHGGPHDVMTPSLSPMSGCTFMVVWSTERK